MVGYTNMHLMLIAIIIFYLDESYDTLVGVKWLESRFEDGFLV